MLEAQPIARNNVPPENTTTTWLVSVEVAAMGSINLTRVVSRVYCAAWEKLLEQRKLCLVKNAETNVALDSNWLSKENANPAQEEVTELRVFKLPVKRVLLAERHRIWVLRR